MKPFLISIVAVVLLCLGAYAIVAVGAKYTARPGAISISTSTVALETETYTIDIASPAFGVPKVDAEIEKIVSRAVEEFKAWPPNPTPIAAKNELVGRYQDVFVSDDLYAARMDMYQFTGGAHGSTGVHGLNFHANGSAYTLAEALDLIGLTLEQVAEQANRELVDRFEMVQFPEGSTPTPENYGTFVIGEDTVTFIFQQYQVEAYAAGTPEIVFARTK